MKNKLSHFFLTAVLLFMATAIFAQEPETAVVQTPTESGLSWVLSHIVFIIGGLVILGAFAALFYLNSMLLQTQKIRLLQEHGIEVLEEVKLLDREPAWKRIAKKFWKRVPMEKEEGILFDHEYDGIRELDNVLPPWWVAMFYISIVFGIGYFGYYHMTDKGLSSAEEYEVSMIEAEKAVKAHLATQADAVDESTVTLLTDANDLGLGQTIYQTNCTPCHGMGGEGTIGPNLTDEYWLHGGGIKNVFKTIKYGVPEKGMISWKSQLRAPDMQKVASYIISLEGTNPPNPKDPQGDKWEGDKNGEEL